ncbi:acyl-CoA-binding domain-containing protein 4 isoform X3 [Phalaenopsis equestris]|uniref:acyl-CoA-binding domain-containing protein 4 isoform X3 n=1 Tax=Phalaenopsis equestris TaxID=78828 RepID=UPI0009E63A9D|nr:acyl-CoA-binding domain-containing protein 4 isoform X3 [Phalaenopsis equestris]
MHDPTMAVEGDKMVNGRYNLNALLSELHYDDWTLLHSFGRRPLARYKHAIAVAQDKLFVIGGSRNGRYFSDVHVFNLRSLTWSLLNPRIDAENIGLENSTSKEVFPTIAGHSLVEWENKLLVIAGHSKEKSDSVIVWSIDLKTLVFSILKTQGKIPMEWSQPDVQGVAVTPRGGHAGATVGDMWYIVGGGNTTRGATETIVLNMSKLAWSDATMVTTQHPLASEGLSLSTISVDEESLLIAFGGYNGRYSNQLFVLRPKPRLPTKPKLYQSPAAAAAAASVTAAYAFATSTGTKDNDPVDENLKKEQVTRHPEAESFATEMLAVEEKNLGSKLADVRRENAKVEGNLEDVRNRQSLLAMELKAVQSQLEAERSRCFKLEIQISDIQKRLDSMVSIERELDILRQERSNMEQDMARVQRQSSGGLLRWMTG